MTAPEFMAFTTHAYGFGKLVHNLLPLNVRHSTEAKFGLREGHRNSAPPSCYQEFVFVFS